jgi:hypothetical protein
MTQKSQALVEQTVKIWSAREKRHWLVLIDCVTLENHLKFDHPLVYVRVFPIARESSEVLHIKSAKFAFVVITKQLYLAMYEDFFRSLIRDFVESHHQILRNVTTSSYPQLLKTWHVAHVNQIFMQSSSDLQDMTIDNELCCFSNVSPLQGMDSLCDLVELWLHMLTG